MKTKSLLLKLYKMFPKKYAKMNHDFVGLMAGKLPMEVNKILICLDFDEEVLPIAKEYKPDLILTHHPFIYGTKGHVLSTNPKKKALYDEVMKDGLCIFSMHTNFDCGKGGMNDALSEALGLKNVKNVPEEIMMRGGELEKEMTPEEFARFANERLHVSYSTLIDKGSPIIKKVAIIGGGGSGKWFIARDNGYDIYVSGDISHHIRRDIMTSNFNYLDMPHEIEKIFIPTMKKIINNIDNSVDILTIDHEIEAKVIC